MGTDVERHCLWSPSKVQSHQNRGFILGPSRKRQHILVGFVHETIAVRVGKTAWIDFVDHGILPPLGVALLAEDWQRASQNQNGDR